MFYERRTVLIPHLRLLPLDRRRRPIELALIKKGSEFDVDRLFLPIEPVSSVEHSFQRPATPSDSQESVLEPAAIPIHQSHPGESLKSARIGVARHDQRLEFLTPRSSPSVDDRLVSVPPEPSLSRAQLSPSEVVPSASIIDASQSDTPSSGGSERLARVSFAPRLQIIPDSIINGKQTTNSIFDQANSTLVRQAPTMAASTPSITANHANKHKLIRLDEPPPSNHARAYPIGSMLTSTSTVLLHHNEAIAHVATASEPFLSDTIFIILIATFTILILLFCFGLFCLCRRTTRRNISPSFDGGSYARVNDHSLETPAIGSGNNYENDHHPQLGTMLASSISGRPSINHHPLSNDGIVFPQTVPLHNHAQQRVKSTATKKKLKKKRLGSRAGCCCCRGSDSATIHARSRMNRTDL